MVVFSAIVVVPEPLPESLLLHAANNNKKITYTGKRNFIFMIWVLKIKNTIIIFNEYGILHGGKAAQKIKQACCRSGNFLHQGKPFINTFFDLN